MLTLTIAMPANANKMNHSTKYILQSIRRSTKSTVDGLAIFQPSNTFNLFLFNTYNFSPKLLKFVTLPYFFKFVLTKFVDLDIF